jgi:KAP P-loop domain protein
MYKKNLFLVLIIYISSYIFNYTYINKTLHFLDWYYLITILFIFLWHYVVDKKSKNNVLILYGISTFLFFLIKILNNIQVFISDINSFIKRINNWNTYLIVGIIGIYFLILIVIKIYKKTENIEKNDEKLYKNREKDKEFVLNFLTNNDNKNIYTLGIDSEYGTGKTFIVEKAIEELEYKKFEIIKIRCMLLEKEEIYSYILKKIRKILSKNSIFTVSFEKLSNTFLKTIDNKFFGGISELLSQNIVIDEIDYFKEVIEKLDKTIILIFDDIDRVNDTEKIERILSFISDFSIKNIKILVLFNSQNLKNIDEKYNRNYLEKYIPVTRKITNIPFIELLKKEITSNNLNEEDFKFLYIIEKEDIYIYPKEYQKMRDVFQFNYDFEILVKGEIEIGSLEFSPRMIKNFIEEVSNFLKLNSEWKIEKRLLIAYVFLKNLYYDEFYEKIENTSKSFVEIFPIKLNFENKDINLTLEDLDLLENIIKNRKAILSDKSKLYGSCYINGKNIFLKKNLFGKNHIDYYLNKIGKKVGNLSIEEKLDTITQFLKDNEDYSIETKNLLIYTLFNYPLYLENKDYKVKERIDKIEKAIKKLTYLGNAEYLSAEEKFYRKFKRSLKKENIKEIRNDFNKIFNEFYHNSNGNTPFYLGTPPGISAMEAIIILGTIEEQEKFLELILYNDKDKISNVYIEAFLKSDIKKSELSDKIIEYFLKDKIKISKDTLYKIIENMERFLFHFHIYNNKNPLKKFYKEYLENLKIELEISKDNNSEIFEELNFIEKVYNKYFDFIDKLLEMLNDNKLNIVNRGIETNISTKTIEPIEKIKNEDDEKLKNEKLEELFNMGIINLQSIREAYKEVNEKD